MNHFSSMASPKDLSDRLMALNVEALSFVARDKAETVARQWLAAIHWRVTDGHRAIARSLALELVLITPSIIGMTAFDRLARGMRGRAPEDIAAVALLCRSQARLARLSGRRFEDLATGETQPLLPSPPSESAGDGVVFGRFAMTADGAVIATGTLVQLDADAQAVARGFIRPGRGLGHPHRCAEAVYRHLVRQGVSTGARRGPHPVSKPPFDPVHNPLDKLAAAWAALDREPGPAEFARAKAFVGQLPLINALVSVHIAQKHGAKRLAEAYRRIAAVVIEAMVMREAHGSGVMALDRAAAEIDAAIARGHYPPETKTLFDTLRERARLAAGRKQNAAGGDLDRLVQRIRALREKTVEQGCTEQEALAAAEKVAELLDRYGLSLSELDLRQQSCEGIGVETGRKRRGPIDDCMGTIATFFDCRVWGETSETGELRYVFFGLPADVQAAVYLHDLVALAFAGETAAFQAGEIYRSTHTSQRRSSTSSFQLGLAAGDHRQAACLARSAERGGGRVERTGSRSDQAIDY